MQIPEQPYYFREIFGKIEFTQVNAEFTYMVF